MRLIFFLSGALGCGERFVRVVGDSDKVGVVMRDNDCSRRAELFYMEKGC